MILPCGRTQPLPSLIPPSSPHCISPCLRLVALAYFISDSLVPFDPLIYCLVKLNVSYLFIFFTHFSHLNPPRRTTTTFPPRTFILHFLLYSAPIPLPPNQPTLHLLDPCIPPPPSPPLTIPCASEWWVDREGEEWGGYRGAYKDSFLGPTFFSQV